MTTNKEVQSGPVKYQVNLDSVLDCQMEDFEHGVVFKDFGEAKEYAVTAFESVIDRLTYLCDQMKAAKEFEDLDLGYWEPLFEEIEGDSPAKENEHTSDSISCQDTMPQDCGGAA